MVMKLKFAVTVLTAVVAFAGLVVTGCNPVDNGTQERGLDPPLGPGISLQESVPPVKTADEDDATVLNQAAEILDRAKASGSSGASVAGEWLSERMKDVRETTSQAADDSGEWATETFRYLKDQGMTSANSTGEWLSDDIKNMGAWNYKVVEIDPNNSGASMELLLNGLGKERWECFHVMASADGPTKLFFKKSRRSYLKSVPIKDVIRLLPLMGGGGEE